jgi:hypothetical protein
VGDVQNLLQNVEKSDLFRLTEWFSLRCSELIPKWWINQREVFLAATTIKLVKETGS